MILACLGKKSWVDDSVDSEQKKRLLPLLGGPREYVSEEFVSLLFHKVEVELKSMHHRTNEGGNLLTLTGLTYNSRGTNAGFGQCNQRTTEQCFSTIHSSIGNAYGD